MTINELEGKNIAILGFGTEGRSLLELLREKCGNIAVIDERAREEFDFKEIEKLEKEGVEFRFGKIPDITEYDFVFRSPGFHPDLPQIVKAKEKGVEISSLTKLFFDLCPSPIIGVTGTKGKGTTAALTYEILKEEARLAEDDKSRRGEDVYLGGNIGISPFDFLENLQKDSIVVLELSSFQLIDIEKSPADAKALAGKPHIAVMLMTTSEHLDYHKDVYEYIDSKRNIFRFQTKDDFAIVNRDYPASNESDIEGEAPVYKVSREGETFEQGCYVRDDEIILKMKERKEVVMSVKDVFLPGRHNLENVCAAILASLFAGANMGSIVKVIKTFKGLEHRLEFVREVRGVKYYDDSFSTTPETAIAAIESFENPKILILGGSKKNSDFTELGKVISGSKSIKAIIGIGKEWTRIKESIKYDVSSIKYIENKKNMEEVVKSANSIAENGDIVLLSPACASFDMFENYKHRGEQFKEEVSKIATN